MTDEELEEANQRFAEGLQAIDPALLALWEAGKLIARRDAILTLLGCKPVQSKVNTQRGT